MINTFSYFYQNEVKMKYISINILPNGSIPPKQINTHRFKYLGFCGIGDGNCDVLQGWFGFPEIFLPTIVPNITSGTVMNTISN